MIHGNLEKHGCEVDTDKTNAAYHASSGLSKSMMGKLLESPAHLKDYLDNPQANKECFLFGQAFEDRLQRPEVFNIEYAKSNYKTLCKKHWEDQKEAMQTLIPAPWFEQIENMAQSVADHDIASQLMTNATKQQLSVYWNDIKHGETCKARIDALSSLDGVPVHVDIKTAAKADPFGFERDAAQFSYWLQATHYSEACNAVDRCLFRRDPIDREFKFLVVEKSPDVGTRHRVEVFSYDQNDIEFGAEVRDRLIAKYMKCKKEDHWPYRPTRERKLILTDGWRDKFKQQIEEAA